MINKLLTQLLFVRIKSVLEKNGWKNYKYMPSNASILFGLRKQEIGSLNCIFKVDNKRGCFVMYFIRDSKLDLDIRSRASEYFTYANYGIVIGNFEMDLTDGEVRYKVSSPIGKNRGVLFTSIPTRRELKHFIDISVATVVRYLKGLESLLKDTSISPKDACEMVEGKAYIQSILERLSSLPEEEKKSIADKLLQE